MWLTRIRHKSSHTLSEVSKMKTVITCCWLTKNAFNKLNRKAYAKSMHWKSYLYNSHIENGFEMLSQEIMTQGDKRRCMVSPHNHLYKH